MAIGDSMDFTYSVDIIFKSTGEVVKRSDVIGMSKAHKLAEGIRINLNDGYFVRITKQD
tara:strand:- start:33713 stop:33889 length:177 start_codon:yes stop_codon:yes gene_type:complete